MIALCPIAVPIPHGPQQYRVWMEVEKPPLPLGESANIEDVLRFDPYAL
jgi:hypothetical protein